MKRALTLLAFAVAACGPDDARHVKVELELERQPCDDAIDCTLALTGNGIVVESRAPEGRDDLAGVAGQSTLYAELSAPSDVLVMVEIAYAAGTTPRIRYREVARGELLFSGRIEDARIAVPEVSDTWLDRGEFSFTARAEAGLEARRVITNGRVIPLDPERVRVTPVPPRGGPDQLETEVVIVVDSGPYYGDGGGCEGDVVDEPSPRPDPSTDPSTDPTWDPEPTWEPDPIATDPTDPTEPVPIDPIDPTDPGDPTEPPPSTGSSPDEASDPSSGGCDDTRDTTSTSGGCEGESSSDGGGCEGESSSDGGGCEGDSSSSGGCEGDTASSAGGCDCEGEAYASSSQGLTAERPARRGFDLERALQSVLRLAWPVVLAGAWNRRRRYFLARGLAVSDETLVRRDDVTTTTVPVKTS
jgi:hypothetical protein